MQPGRAATACTFQEKQNRLQSADYSFLHWIRRMDNIIFKKCAKAHIHIHLCPIIWINLIDWLICEVPPLKRPTFEKFLSLLFIWQPKAILVQISSDAKSKEELMDMWVKTPCKGKICLTMFSDSSFWSRHSPISHWISFPSNLRVLADLPLFTCKFNLQQNQNI